MSHTIDAPAAPRVDEAAELAALLPPECFPARQDQLLASLVRRRAPAWALWRLCRLPASGVYESAGDLQEALARRLEGHVPLEPM